MAEFKVWACKENQEEVVQLHPNCGNSQIQREGNIVYLFMGVWQASRRIHRIGNIIVAIFSENTVCHSKQYVIWLHQTVLIYKPDLKITASNKPPPGILPESLEKKKWLDSKKIRGRHRERVLYHNICIFACHFLTMPEAQLIRNSFEITSNQFKNSNTLGLARVLPTVLWLTSSRVSS